MRYRQAYVDTEGEMHLIDLDQCFEQGWDLLTHNATRDATWAYEAQRCLGNLELDLNYCLDPATRDSSGKKKRKRHRWHLRAPGNRSLCAAEEARLSQDAKSQGGYRTRVAGR